MGLRVALVVTLLCATSIAQYGNPRVDSLLLRSPFLVLQQGGKTDSLLQVIAAQNDTALRLSAEASEGRVHGQTWPSRETMFWLFSAEAQAFAAFIALAALFAVFKLQVLLQRVREFEGEVSRAFDETMETALEGGPETHRLAQRYKETWRYRRKNCRAEVLRPIYLSCYAPWLQEMKGSARCTTSQKKWAARQLFYFELLLGALDCLRRNMRDITRLALATAIANGVVVAASLWAILYVARMTAEVKFVVAMTLLVVGILALALTVTSCLLIMWDRNRDLERVTAQAADAAGVELPGSELPSS